MSDHKGPIPWPVRPVILLLMGLPPTASEEEYLERWDAFVVPLLAKSLTDLFVDRVREIQRTENRTWNDAWALARLRNKALADAMDDREGAIGRQRRRRF